MFKWLSNLFGGKKESVAEDHVVTVALLDGEEVKIVLDEPVEVLVADERKVEAPKAEAAPKKKNKPRNRRPQPAVASAKNVPAKKGGKKDEKKPAPKKAPAKAPAKTKVAKSTKQ